MKILVLLFSVLATAALAHDIRTTAKLTVFGFPTGVIASLPACTANLNNTVRTVTDALTPTVGATVANGGAVTTLVHCNGTNWIVG